MLPKGYRNPASPSASQLFWGIIVSRLTLVVAAPVGFTLPPLATGQLLPALRDATSYIVTILVLWFGLGLLSLAFWSQLFGEVGAPTWMTQETRQADRRRYLLMRAFIGLAVGLILGSWYVHAFKP